MKEFLSTANKIQLTGCWTEFSSNMEKEKQLEKRKTNEISRIHRVLYVQANKSSLPSSMGETLLGSRDKRFRWIDKPVEAIGVKI